MSANRLAILSAKAPPRSIFFASGEGSELDRDGLGIGRSSRGSGSSADIDSTSELVIQRQYDATGAKRQASNSSWRGLRSDRPPRANPVRHLGRARARRACVGRAAYVDAMGLGVQFALTGHHKGGKARSKAAIKNSQKAAAAR